MSNKPNDNLDDDLGDIPVRPRIDILKERAKLMGIPHSPNIGEAALAKKIEEHDRNSQGIVADLVDTSGYDSTEKLSRRELRILARKAAQKLIRVNVMPADPMRSQLNGELIFVGNAEIGTLGKLIPFSTPGGYHIPEMIYRVLKEKTFTMFRTKKDNFGNEIAYAIQRPAYNIEILKPLNEKQIKKIADRQQLQAKYDEEQDPNYEIDED